jgi:hypothetical protein
MTRRLGSIVCLGAMMIAASAAQSVSPAINGKVVAAENGRVLPRARIVVLADGQPVESILTDDRGLFTLPPTSTISRTASPSNVVLAITKAGYAVQRVDVSRPAAAESLTVRLSRAVAIAGRIADPNGEGAVDVRVVAVRQDPVPGDPTPERFEATTDDLGEYRLGGLPAGRYEVGMQGKSEPAKLELRAGDEIGSINFSRLVNDSVTANSREASVSRPLAGQEGTGAISGRVLSAAGRPIASAQVRALRNGLTPRGTPTDQQGRFTIEQLPAGPYIVEASRNGYVRVQYGQQRAATPGKEVHVRDHVNASGIDITLPRGTAVTGAVVDEHGEPLQGVSVRAMQLRHVNGRSTALNVGPRDRRTDDRGRYRIHGLLPGSYLIVAAAEATISGTQARGYAPVFYPGTTQASEASPIVADLARDVPAIDLVLTQTPVARVTAIARTSDGTPFSGLVFMMASQRSGAVAVEPQPPAAGPDGSFVFTNVPPGDYIVQAMRAREQNRGMSEFGAQLVTIVKGDPQPIVITTWPGATMTGRLLYEWEGSTSKPPMEQAPSFLPLPVDFDRAPAVGGGTVGWSTTPDGSFSVSGLFGPTRFQLMGRRDDWYLKSITIGALDVTDTPFDFGAGTQTVAGAEIVVSNGSAAISGHVTDAQSAPVSNYAVVVFPVDRTKWFATSRFLRLARPAQDGSFEVTGLPPGEYWLAATDPVEGNEISGDWLKAETLDQLSFRATRIALTERQRLMTVLRIIRR